MLKKLFRHLVVAVMFCFVEYVAGEELADRLQALSVRVSTDDDRLRSQLARDIDKRLKACNQASTAAWQTISSRDDWEKYRDQTLNALRQSLGRRSLVPARVQAQETSAQIQADGYSVAKLVYPSFGGLRISANLYMPTPAVRKVPGIILSHSHHAPKTQKELQEMGAMWARAGCFVLVPDHLGHGDRRQHPFTTASDYPDKFQVSRQDYYFRYNEGIQLYLVGESLMGCMAGDLICGVDVLMQQKDIDPERIAIFGAVAGGGDPAAVAAALDERIKLVVPFNFGGPQPESKYPLPEDSETTFDYAGGGGWESSRNLARSARDGFLPWAIVASIAPRGLIHAHEFSWDREHDPVWKRYERIFGFYDAQDKLDFTLGFGVLKQSSAEASHCDNIGRPHRARIHEFLKRHWNIVGVEDDDFAKHSVDDLTCVRPGDKLLSLGEALEHQANAQLDEIGKRTRQECQAEWKKLLGDVEPYAFESETLRGKEIVDAVNVERWLLVGERKIALPMVLLLPSNATKANSVVIVVAQQGKERWLAKKSNLAARLSEHSAVCLVDLRGTGESKSSDDRGRRSDDTSYAASELMLGETLLGSRLRDLRSVHRHLLKRFPKAAILGDSLAPINSNETVVARPLDVAQPTMAEPMGPLVALLFGLFTENRTPIVARGGILDYRSLLDQPFIYVPFDVIVPGAIPAGDLPLVGKNVCVQHPTVISDLVDGVNRIANATRVEALYGETAKRAMNDEEVVEWFVKNLQ